MIDLRSLDRIKTYGNSMYPLLRDGDIVFYKKVSYQDILVNDLIVVQSEKSAYTHRVVYKTDTCIITKGDNNVYVDASIGQSQVIGRVTHVKRKGKMFDPELFYQMQSGFYFQEICRINRLFQKAAIRYLFLKGLPLHLYYEGTYPRRIYADCDILIDKRDLEKIYEIFHKAGYITQKKYEEVITEVSFFIKTKGSYVVFDIHISPVFMMTQIDVSDIFYPRNLLNALTRECLDTKEHIVIDREKFPILNAHMLIVYLALHFFHHNYHGLFRLGLIPAIEKKRHMDRSDWIKIEDLIKRYQLEFFVRISFHVIKTYMKCGVPHEFLLAFPSKSWKIAPLQRRYSIPHILEDQRRIRGGIERFCLLFILSSTPIRVKMTNIFIYLLNRTGNLLGVLLSSK